MILAVASGKGGKDKSASQPGEGVRFRCAPDALKCGRTRRSIVSRGRVVICDEQEVLTLVEIPDDGSIGDVDSRGPLIITPPGIFAPHSRGCSNSRWE